MHTSYVPGCVSRLFGPHSQQLEQGPTEPAQVKEYNPFGIFIYILFNFSPKKKIFMNADRKVGIFIISAVALLWEPESFFMYQQG